MSVIHITYQQSYYYTSFKNHKNKNKNKRNYVFIILQMQLSIFPQFPLWLQLCIQLYHLIGLFRNRSSCISVRIQNGSNVTPVSISITIVEHYSIVHNFHCNCSPFTSLYRFQVSNLSCIHCIVTAILSFCHVSILSCNIGYNCLSFHSFHCGCNFVSSYTILSVYFAIEVVASLSVFKTAQM